MFGFLVICTFVLGQFRAGAFLFEENWDLGFESVVHLALGVHQNYSFLGGKT